MSAQQEEQDIKLWPNLMKIETDPKNSHPVARKTHEKYVTISIDDGHPSDLRTVELLSKYGLQATFYIPGSNDEREVMSSAQIREVDQQFEVGSHTLHHVRLHKLAQQECLREIVDGRKFSEDTV